MKLFGVIFLVLFILIFLFAKITVNYGKNPTIWQRVHASAIAALLLSIVIGLPLFGIIYLITH